MILWSPMPLELVLAGFAAEASAGTLRRVELPVPGGWVIADVDAKGKAVVARLVATDPQAYLEPRLHPGSVLRGGANPDEFPSGSAETDADWGGTPGG